MEEEKPKRKSREMLKNRRMGNPENKLLGKATVQYRDPPKTMIFPIEVR